MPANSPNKIIIIIMEEAAGIAFPAEHFEHVGQSLPELTTELLSAHTTQSSEIREKEGKVQRLGAELGALQEQLQVLNREVCKTVRTIYLKEEVLCEVGEECGRLEGKVAGLVEEKEAVGAALGRLRKEKEAHERVKESYEMKMECHKMKTHRLEQLSATQMELSKLKEKIASLKEKSMTISMVTLNFPAYN